MPKKKINKKEVSPIKNVSEKQKTISELIKNNIFLHQYCDLINSENNKNSLEIQKLMSHVLIMDNHLVELKKMFEFVISRINPNQYENIKKEFEICKDKKNKVENKKSYYHDNVTTKCKNCKSIILITDTSCKECGFNF